MYRNEFDANNVLSGKNKTATQIAIANADAKRDMEALHVCITTTGKVVTLTDFAVKVRDDIAQVVYSNEQGYTFNANNR
jgi:hypothetical protein